MEAGKVPDVMSPQLDYESIETSNRTHMRNRGDILNSGDFIGEEDGEGSLQQEPREKKMSDFELKNLEKLREMQDARIREAQLIEEARSKEKRRQEKLKNNILKEAQEYKALKAARAAAKEEEEE